jgi:hypothetical protein
MNTDFLPVVYVIEAAMALAALVAVAIMIGLAVDTVRAVARGSARTAGNRDALQVALGRVSHQH